MKRTRGHTLVEMSVYMAGLLLVGGSALAVISGAEADRRTATSLADDADALRRATAEIGRDVRASSAADVTDGVLRTDAATWRLAGDALLRTSAEGERRVAGRVAAFTAHVDASGAVCARVELSPRTPGAPRRASLATVARPRVTGEAR